MVVPTIMRQPILSADRGWASISIAALSMHGSTAIPRERPTAVPVLDAVAPSRSESVPKERTHGSSSPSKPRSTPSLHF